MLRALLVGWSFKPFFLLRIYNIASGKQKSVIKTPTGDDGSLIKVRQTLRNKYSLTNRIYLFSRLRWPWIPPDCMLPQAAQTRRSLSLTSTQESVWPSCMDILVGGASCYLTISEMLITALTIFSFPQRWWHNFSSAETANTSTLSLGTGLFDSGCLTTHISHACCKILWHHFKILLHHFKILLHHFKILWHH